MIILYFIVGFITAVIAAVPPGAANIIIINTSINKSLKQALYIAIGAGLGEVLLSIIALHSAMTFTSYFKQHPWVQITSFSIFLLVGIYFLVKNKLDLKIKKSTSIEVKTPKIITGFMLAFLNPPVLIFWVLAFTIIHSEILKVSETSTFFKLFLFFSGVYVGKVATLYAYGKWGKALEEKSSNSLSKKDLFIGCGLTLVGVIQGIRFLLDSI